MRRARLGLMFGLLAVPASIAWAQEDAPTTDVAVEGRGFSAYYFMRSSDFNRLRSDVERIQALREIGAYRRGDPNPMVIGRHYYFFPICPGRRLQLRGIAAVRIRPRQTSLSVECPR